MAEKIAETLIIQNVTLTFIRIFGFGQPVAFLKKSGHIELPVMILGDDPEIKLNTPCACQVTITDNTIWYLEERYQLGSVKLEKKLGVLEIARENVVTLERREPDEND